MTRSPVIVFATYIKNIVDRVLLFSADTYPSVGEESNSIYRAHARMRRAGKHRLGFDRDILMKNYLLFLRLD